MYMYMYIRILGVHTCMYCTCVCHITCSAGKGEEGPDEGSQLAEEERVITEGVHRNE